MTACRVALSVIVLGVAGATTAGRPDTKAELARFDGRWEVVSGEEDGRPLSDYLVKHLGWEFKAGVLTFSGFARLTDKASRLRVVVDPTTTPRCLDLTVEAGSEKGGVMEGVYEWTRDGLRVCLHAHFTERIRPPGFEAAAGSNRVVFVLRRVP